MFAYFLLKGVRKGYIFNSYYENAKNYKLITKGNYVLFVISEQADELVTVYDSFFNEQ